MVATRAADDRCSPGNGDAPLVRQGAHRERRSTEPEACHQGEEEVEYEPLHALRGQKIPPPGERPAPLSEVAGPQRSDRTVRHSAGEAPLLVVPSLRGADGVDGTTVSYLLAENLKLQKKEEEKERRREREEAQHEARMRELDRRVWADEQLTPAESHAWRKWAGHLPSEPRRKKKRKKKKLPRAPRPRQGCRRLCDHQRQVPAVLIPVMMQRQVPTVHSFMLPVQFLDTVLDMPVVVLRQVPGSKVQKTADSLQLHSVQVVDSSFVQQRQFPMVQTIHQTTEIFQLLFDSGGRCPCCVGRACHAALVSTTTVCAHGWLCWLRYTSCVFPLGCRRPLMLVILADMDQKDSYASGSSMFKAGKAS